MKALSLGMTALTGASFVPAGPTDACHATASGCGCAVAAEPARDGLAALFAAALLLWLRRRRGRLA